MQVGRRLRHARSSSTARSRTSTARSARRSCWSSLIIFLFLRSFRATLIPLVTIPVSLIGAFALMLALGFSHQHADPARRWCWRSASSSTTRSSMLENIYPACRGRHAAVPGGADAAAARSPSRSSRMTLTLAAVYRADRRSSTGTTGQAVHRVRLDAGRRGAGLGLRRADAVADDVLEAAAARGQAQLVLHAASSAA